MPRTFHVNIFKTDDIIMQSKVKCIVILIQFILLDSCRMLLPVKVVMSGCSVVRFCYVRTFFTSAFRKIVCIVIIFMSVIVVIRELVPVTAFIVELRVVVGFFSSCIAIFVSSPVTTGIIRIALGAFRAGCIRTCTLRAICFS